MAINLEVKNEIEKRTRRLGTKADSYLNEFFDIFYQYSTLKDMNEFYTKSKRMSKASEATRKQFVEILSIFRVIDLDLNIKMPKLLSKESYHQILTTNIKTTLKKIDAFESIYKNTKKLINNFIYIYGIEVLKEYKYDISEIYDKSLENRTNELKVSNILIDTELKEILIKGIRLLIDECGIEVKLDDHEVEQNKHSIPENDYDEDKIDMYKAKLESNPSNVFDIVKLILDPERKLVIPFYQREYVWTKELILGLITEIASGKNEILNIGNILISINGTNSSVRDFALVDGQQRITSLILIMNYLSKSLSSSDLSKYNIQPCLIDLINKCKTSKFIKNLINRSNPLYIENLKEVLDLPIGDLTQSKNTPIKSNYDVVALFIESLETTNDKVNLFNKLSYVFSTISYDSLSDEIELFIITNSSRKPLSNFDLIKSFIISNIPENTTKKDDEEINALMSEISELLKFKDNSSESAEDAFFTLFLNYSDITSNENISNVKDLFKRFRLTFKDRLSTNKDVKILLNNIKSILLSYRVVKEIDVIPYIYIKDFVLSLGQGLKVTSIYDIFMVYMVEKVKLVYDPKDKVKLLNEFRSVLLIIEKFEIKWKLFTFSGDSLSNSLTSLFVKFFDKVNDQIEENSYEDVLNAFNDIINDEDEVTFVSKVLNDTSIESIDKFLESQNIQKQKNALKILNRVGFNLFNSGIKYKSTSSNYYYHLKPTIEHIFPKTHTKWSKDDKTNAVELEPYLEEIGNKFIFNKAENSSAGNKNFKEKINHYKDYNDLKLDKTLDFVFEGKDFNLLKKDKWTKEDVELRSKYIITELLKIWSK